MNYEEKYAEYIYSGLNESKCHHKGQEIGLDEFMDHLINISKKTQNDEGRIFFIGNGASAAFSNHMALDWSKNGKINAYVLSDSAMLTALSNDYSYVDAFREYLRIEKCSGKDIVVTISSSGNSPNIVNVLTYCKENKITCIGFSGLKSNNKTIDLAEYSLYVPRKTYGMVECIHQIFLHMWLDKFMKIKEWDRKDVQNMNIKEFKL